LLRSLALVMTISLPAYAQTPACDSRDVIINSLIDDYDESRRSISLSKSGNVFEIFASDKGSWSLVVTWPNGPSCLIDSGTSWENLDIKEKGLKL